MRKRLSAVILSGILAFQVVAARTIRVPSDFHTITAALTKVDYGDTVIVSPGRYHENVTLAQGVVLRGTDPSKCIIDGMRRGPVVYGVTGAEISHFTITNGIDGILCENASLYIHHNWIVDNEGSGIGAFIALPQIYNNVIYGNRWCGILIWGAKALDTRIENNVLIRNGYSGLALRGPSRVVVRNNVIMENLEYGIYSDPASSQSQIIYNDIFHNVSSINRYANASSKSNISADPMFLNSSLSHPNFFCAVRSPLRRRGYDQVDIGLLAHDPAPSPEVGGKTEGQHGGESVPAVPATDPVKPAR
jgi:OmpA-OmpF porin, OOP family